jgi:hypothetical protein
MSPRSIALALLVSVPVTPLLIACSGDDGSQFQNGNGTGSTDNAGPQNPNGNIGGMGGPQPTSAACVTSTANAALSPVNLVVMYDKSGSMGDTSQGFDPKVKWIPVTTGMKAFFSDPKSVGIAASLQFFPQGSDLGSVCGFDYATPKVSLTPLASATPLSTTLDATQPSGGTPTLPAIEGAIKYATSVAAQRPNEKTFVVLVTDGDPGFGINGQFAAGCANNDIPHVANAAKAAAAASPAIKTYVIGVGLDVQNLDAIATAGGTNKAIMVPVSDPTQTKTVFQGALDSIRTDNLSCELALPPPPNGKALDINAVNVVFTNGSGQESVLTYNASCAGGAGWHYDDAASPSKIELCASTCTQAQADRQGKLTIAFGCRTVSIPR